MTTPPTESRGVTKWPFIIVGLLGLNMAICAITITAAVTRPAIIEPDYYEKALNWDESRAAKQSEQGDTLASERSE